VLRHLRQIGGLVDCCKRGKLFLASLDVGSVKRTANRERSERAKCYVGKLNMKYLKCHNKLS
jgi:hypothetical protein